ncbi:hypothetical protein C8Q78DRAFT_1083327 [Trametes maxima]|nr:hypothetical protein C8Q78DRAFT_1083327 [Trametes maxima]
MDDCVVNFDILEHIISFCRCRITRAAVTRTCRFLHQTCLKYLVEDTVEFLDEGTLWGFLHWTFRDAYNRAPFIRGLRFAIYTFYDPEVAGRLLAKSLRDLRPLLSISQLTIHNADTFLGSHPDLIPAIASLTTLTNIALYDIGDNARALLRFSRASLTTVLARPEIDFPDVRVRPFDTDPTIMLASQTRSLTSITVFRMNVTSHDICFPNVSSLVLNEIPLPLTQAYVRSFPNLRKLSIFGERWSEDPSETWTRSLQEDLITPRRRLNMREQQRRGTWASLSHYEGSPIALYALGLTFHIPYVSLVDEDETTGDLPIDLKLFRDILLPSRPQHLSISFTGATEFLEEGIVPFLSYSQDLSSLALTIVPVWTNNNISMDDFLVACISILRDLHHITSFTFHISCIWLSTAHRTKLRPIRARGLSAPEPDSLCPFEVSMQDYDFDDFARCCLSATSSLRDVTVGLDEHEFGIKDVSIRLERVMA